jgi:valyl-tRNA synthetase
MSVDNQTININEGETEFGLAERWIKTRLVDVIEQVTEGIRTYRFDLATQAMREFTWDEYCDWYLELSKTTLSDPSATEAARRGTLKTLVTILESLLRLMHPFIPFITEELWQRVAPIINRNEDTIMLQAYPGPEEFETDESSLGEIAWVKTFILGVRRIRAERDIAPGKKLTVQVKGGTEQEKHWLENNNDYLQVLGKIDIITEIESEPGDAVVALAGHMTLLVPLADLIDLQAELGRLGKELDKLNIDKDRIQKKLENDSFVNRAPDAVVNKERQRLNETIAALTKLQDQHARIKQLAN